MLEAVWAGDAGKKEQVQPHCPHLNIQTPRVWLETPQSSHKASPRSLLSLSGMQLSCLALSDIGVCKLFLNSCSCLSVLGAGVSFNREHFLPRNLWATLQMDSASPPPAQQTTGRGWLYKSKLVHCHSEATQDLTTATFLCPST